MLIVDDDAVIRELLDSYFTSEGFEVVTRTDGSDCAELVSENNFDICLIDIRLPGEDGLSLTHRIRSLSDVGIILVTSKDELIDKIVGLESGADDYVTKPFEMRELLSRVKNVVRRTSEGRVGKKALQSAWLFNGWTFELNKRSLIPPDGGVVQLSEGEYQLMHALVENSEQVMTRDQLMQRIRNRDWHPDDRYVDVLVVKLRQKFKRRSPKETFITTIHGKGYLFEPEVTTR